MDAFLMEEVFDAFSCVHVRGRVVTLNVCRGDDSAPSQLPDVQLMDCQNPLKTPQLFVQPLHVNLLGHGLQQDEGGLLQQWEGSIEQDGHQDYTECGIQVEHPTRSCYSDSTGTIAVDQVRIIHWPVVRAVATQAWVNTYLLIVTCPPHECENESINHDNDRAKGIAQHMQEDSTHVELGRRI